MPPRRTWRRRRCSRLAGYRRRRCADRCAWQTGSRLQDRKEHRNRIGHEGHGRRRGGERMRRGLRGTALLLWTGGVLRLRGSGRRGAFAQLATGRLAGPGTRIDLAHDTEPFLGFRECREISHVQAKTFATFLEAPAHEEREALELGQIGLRERHRRGRRTQIQDEGSGVCDRCDRVPCAELCESISCEVGRCCHNFPEKKPCAAAVLKNYGSW